VSKRCGRGGQDANKDKGTCHDEMQGVLQGVNMTMTKSRRGKSKGGQVNGLGADDPIDVKVSMRDAGGGESGGGMTTKEETRRIRQGGQRVNKDCHRKRGGTPFFRVWEERKKKKTGKERGRSKPLLHC